MIYKSEIQIYWGMSGGREVSLAFFSSSLPSFCGTDVGHRFLACLFNLFVLLYTRPS